MCISFYIFRFKRVSDSFSQLFLISFPFPDMRCPFAGIFYLRFFFLLDAAVECTIPRDNIERIWKMLLFLSKSCHLSNVCFFIFFFPSRNKRIPCRLNIITHTR